MDDELFADMKDSAEIEDDVSRLKPPPFPEKTEKSGFARLLDRIPGIRGYVAKNERREADEALRAAIGRKLEAARLQLSNVHQQLGQDIVLAMEYAERLGNVDTRLRGLTGKVMDAPTGYTGFLARHTIDETDLERIYSFDAQFFDYADEIGRQVAALEETVTVGGDIGSALTQLNAAVQQAASAFAERQEILAGMD